MPLKHERDDLAAELDAVGRPAGDSLADLREQRVSSVFLGCDEAGEVDLAVTTLANRPARSAEWFDRHYDSTVRPETRGECTNTREDADGLQVTCTSLGKLRFTSPAGEDLEDALNDDGELDLAPSSTVGGEFHSQLMRDFYDHALSLECRLSIHEQGGESISDASLIPDSPEYHSIRSNPT